MNGQQQLQPSKLTQNNLESTNGITCPSCGDFFDSGKKRRLIDNCGHERCYTCMFNKGFCSICNDQGIDCSRHIQIVYIIYTAFYSISFY